MTLYNTEIKNVFLNTQNKKKLGNYTSIFNKSFHLENKKDKDLFDFELEEIIELIALYEGDTWDAIQTQAVFISSYIDWAIDSNSKGVKYNPLASNRTVWISEMLKGRKVAIPFSEFRFYTHYLENAADSCLLWLIFEGVKGNDLEEISNLTKFEVDGDKRELTLQGKDKDGKYLERNINVSDECMKYIKLSIETNTYSAIDKNSEPDKKAKKRKIIDSDYVIRPTVVDIYNEPYISYRSLVTRLQKIANFYDDNLINVSKIRDSGIYYYAKVMVEKRGTLDKEIVSTLIEKYGISLTNAGLKMRLRRMLPLIYPEVAQYLYTKKDIIKRRISLLDQRVRDGSVVKDLKNLYENKCQVCAETVVLLPNYSYSEVHHIYPIKDNGPDSKCNMIVLCPNHHKMFDIGVISLKEDGETLIHIDEHHILHNQKLKLNKHKIEQKNINFQFQKYFIPLKI